MLVLSRDADWIERLERLAARGGWTVAARAELSARGERTAGQALVLLDRALAGPVPARAVAVLRESYPEASVVLVCVDEELSPAAVAAALSSGADETVVKTWPDSRLADRLASLRDAALAAGLRLSADGALKVDRRSRRAYARARGRWETLPLTAPDLELLWRLLIREGEDVTRAELLQALKDAFGREVEAETVSRRILALRRALKPWRGGVLESVRGGRYRLASSRRRSTT
jgi:DNA-binding response OmpR family regulator